MAEIRVYDLSLIKNVQETEDARGVLNRAQDAWYNKKNLELDQPYFMPYHRESL
jgi:uncharacterized protein YecT (DUF1311 family)